MVANGSGQTKLPCNVVLSGGGVRGIAQVGALTVLERRYRPNYIAGCSGGAIVATLYAAGFNTDELHQRMAEDFSAFLEETPLEHLIRPVGDAMQLLLHLGIYRTHRLYDFIAIHLKEKNKITFGDLKIRKGSPEYRALPLAIQAEIDKGTPRYVYPLHVIAADLTDNSMLILPDDVQKVFGEDPDAFPLAMAALMSASVPGLFEPTRYPRRDSHIIVDGGLVSAYPLFFFDEDNPPWPTFGFHLVDGTPGTNGTLAKPVMPELGEHPIHSPIDFATNLFQTLLDGRDNVYIETADFARSIVIPCATPAHKFDLSDADKTALFQSGVDAATDFFGPDGKKWDYAQYQQAFITNKPKRRDLVAEYMQRFAPLREPTLAGAPAGSDKGGKKAKKHG